MPRHWQEFLRRVLPLAERAEVLTDLAELHAVRSEREGRAAANAWYRRQVLGFAWRAALGRRPGGRRVVENRRRTSVMDRVRQDLRQALRSLRRRPGYAAIAVLTLALGVGANTAVFSAVNGVLMRPLPFDEPDRIVRVYGYNVREGLTFGTISYLNFVDWRERARSFESAAAYDEYRTMLTGEGGEPERIDGASVNSAYFDVLGVRPAAGRFFLPEEDEPGTSRSLVLSWGFWQRRFGGAPSAVGSTLQLNGIDYTVVGIAPRDFEDPQLSGRTFGSPQFWRVSPSYFPTNSRGSKSFTAVARLRPGVTVEQAQQELDVIMRDLSAEYPDENTNRALAVRGLLDGIVSEARTPLLVLLGAAGLVLLIACANVANLALVRALDAERDFVVRAALGASRRRVAGQVLVENGVLALLGGAAGIAVAVAGTRLLRGMVGGELARVSNIALDVPVLLFTVASVFAAALLFGMAPLLAVSRADLAGALREGGRGSSAGRARRRLQRGLVAAEVALSCALLVGAGLMLRSFAALQRVDTGVDADNVVVLSYSPPLFAYDTIAQVVQLYRQVDERLNAIPGVRIAGAVDILPMSGSFNGNRFTIEGRAEPPAGEGWSAEVRVVSPGALPTLDIDVAAGRGFASTDDEGAAPVMIINETLARTWWPDDSPLGARVTVFGEAREVVGVVRDVREFSPDRAILPGIYLPYEQVPFTYTTLVMRADRDPMSVAARATAILREIEPRAAIGTPRTMQSVVDATMTPARFRSTLLGIFAAIALALSMVGIYGVVSRGVTRRRQEMGIRMSLGANRGTVVGLVLRDAAAPVAAGIVVGLLGAYILSRALSGLLFGIARVDAVSFVVAPALLALTAIVACLIPARRAAGVDPATVLRTD